MAKPSSRQTRRPGASSSGGSSISSLRSKNASTTSSGCSAIWDRVRATAAVSSSENGIAADHIARPEAARAVRSAAMAQAGAKFEELKRRLAAAEQGGGEERIRKQ